MGSAAFIPSTAWSPRPCSHARKLAPRRAATVASAGAPTEDSPLLSWGRVSHNGSHPLLLQPLTQLVLDKIAAYSLDGLARRSVPGGLDYHESADGHARVGAELFSSATFEKIRVSYIDAGESHGFATMWQPRPQFDAPVLTIETSTNRASGLTVIMDFMPLSRDAAYVERYCARMERVRGRYPALGARINPVMYDKFVTVSPQVVYARVPGQTVLQEEVVPAARDYLDEYVSLFDKGECVADERADAVLDVQHKQRAMAQFMAENDPFRLELKRKFGDEWSHRFWYDYMYSDAVPPQERSE